MTKLFIAPLSEQGTVTTEANRRELGLKLFSGEVLNAFYDSVLTEGRIRTITINEGISAQFPHTGKVKGGFHKPGTQIALNETKQDERIISLDDIIYASAHFPYAYDLIGHLNFRQEYAAGFGQVMGLAKDTLNLAELLKAARSAAIIASETDGGSQIVSDKFKMSADAGVDGGAVTEKELALAIFNAVFMAAELYDTKNVPWMNRVLALRPYHYHLLVRTIMDNGFSLSNVDYMGTRADINNAVLPRIAGIEILKSNRVPSTNLTATGDAHGGSPNTLAYVPVHTNHTVDASKTIGIIWTPEAVGNVMKAGMATKMEDQVDYLGNLLVTYMLMGGGVLRPEAAIELTLDSLSN